MADLSLFGEAELEAPALRLGTEAMKARLVPAYAKELLANPPVRSLVPSEDVEESERARLATTYANRDVARLLKVLIPAGLELSDRGRTGTFKELLADWLIAVNDHNGEEIDVNALVERTREVLGVF